MPIISRVGIYTNGVVLCTAFHRWGGKPRWSLVLLANGTSRLKLSRGGWNVQRTGIWVIPADRVEEVEAIFSEKQATAGGGCTESTTSS